MRKKIIAGNWKMNIKPSETAALVKGVAEATKDFALSLIHISEPPRPS